MDRSSFFTNSPLSPLALKPRPSIGMARQKSRLSISGKSLTNVQIVLKSAKNYAERFGQPLPVLITEALKFAGNTAISAKISNCGYAWVVCGRRLLIWQYRLPVSTPQKRHTGINQCFELQLPQSDLANRAELVSVFTSPGSHMASCIAVSPEGLLRYWPAVAHEGVTVERSVDLQGQECDSLTNIEGLGCVLATTTCTVVLVQFQMQNGRHTLHCHPLKMPSGWFGGIGRRMSSLIFGPSSSEQLSEPRSVRVLSIPNRSNIWTVYVLAGHSLQKWILSTNEPEVLVSITELNHLVRESFYGALWDNGLGDHTEIKTFILDIQPERENIVILAVAVNIQMSLVMHYALITLITDGPTAEICNFSLLKMSGLYRDDKPCDSLSYRFLLSGSQIYVYNSKTITVIKPKEEPDILDISSQDVLLGGSVCTNTPVFFLKFNGLVAIYSNEHMDVFNQSSSKTMLDASFSETANLNNLSVYNLNPTEILNAYQDTVGQLKAAFIFYIRKELQYKDIVAELFPPESMLIPSLDNTLDKVVLKITKDILDDFPAGDPRWSENNNAGIGSSYSVQVLYQLEDKQKAMSLFIAFLKITELWNKLSGCILRDRSTATVHALAEMCEKLCAAIVMKGLPNTLILENGIEKAVEDFYSEPINGLTNQDVFYREVSKIHKGLQEVVNNCENVAQSDLSSSQIAQIVHDTNEIVLTVLNEVVQYRYQQSESFTLPDSVKSLNLEYLPWTAAGGEEGVADSLILQHNLTFNYGLKLVNNGPLRNTLLEQFVALTDLILDGQKCHLESIKNSPWEKNVYKQYCTDKHKLIKPLLNEKEWEKAARLAEKYLDFDSLVIICEMTDNQDRIDEYIDRFSAEGFSEFAYNWFLKQNKHGKLMDKYRKTGKKNHVQKFSYFLKDHPSLLWIQQINDNEFSKASETLYNLAIQETESLTRQKTMLSQSKLCALSSSEINEDDPYIANIDARLDLIVLQEDLPDYVLQKFGYDTDRPCVIPPKDLVNLYISKEYSDAGELEFKKALEILNFIEDEKLKEDLHLMIWRNAILRDSWGNKNLDCPLEALEGTLFFKLAELSLMLGADPNTLLPPLDLLLEDESMEDLRESNNFQFLLKAGYENVLRMQIIE